MGSLCAKNAIEKFSRLGTFNIYALTNYEKVQISKSKPKKFSRLCTSKGILKRVTITK